MRGFDDEKPHDSVLYAKRLCFNVAAFKSGYLATIHP